jgi:hypothetical protein
MSTKNIVSYHPAVVKRGHPEVIGLLSEPKYYPGLLSIKLKKNKPPANTQGVCL